MAVYLQIAIWAGRAVCRGQIPWISIECLLGIVALLEEWRVLSFESFAKLGCAGCRGMAAAKARGVRLGANGARLAELRKAGAIEFAERMREPMIQSMRQGAETLQRISDNLNCHGHRTREGTDWSLLANRDRAELGGEEIHAWQYAHGMTYASYLAETAISGYWNNRFEVQAREVATDLGRRYCRELTGMGC